MNTIFETVRENVLWEMLLSAQSYINLIAEAKEEVFEDERAALIEEIEAKCKDYYNKDRSFLVITEYYPEKEEEKDTIYSMDDLTGTLSTPVVLVNCDRNLLSKQNMALRYKTYWFIKFEGYSTVAETDIHGGVIYNDDWCNRILTIKDDKAIFEWVNL